MKTILGNTKRLIALVEDTLARSKIEETWMSLNLKTGDLHGLIKRTVEEMKIMVEMKKQSIKYLHSGLVSEALFDEKWIEQALINLIHNASKHMNRGDTIFVGLQENDFYHVIKVSDNGQGIRDKEMGKIFTEYYQSGKPTDSLVDGIGLGLAIVRQVAQAHGGKLYVTSTEGYGTMVVITLLKQEKETLR